MTIRTRTWIGVAGLLASTVAVGATGLSVAADQGYGVGDGTGPIGLEPQDGTGEQHHGPPAGETLTIEIDTGDVGYGVGDGTGPIGLEPQDGTGEQHHAPPSAIVPGVTVLESTVPPCDATCAADQLRLQEQLRAQEQLRLQEQLQPQDPCEQEQLRIQEELREQEQLRSQHELRVQAGN